MLAAVILAAGGSSRMGGNVPKQLLKFRGESLIRRAIRTAAEVPTEQIVVVLGNAAEQIMEEIDGTGATVVLNEHWQDGISSSLRGGLVAVLPEARGVFVYPADMPLVSVQMLRNLAGGQQSSGRPCSMTEVNGVRGVPTYITRSLFSPLMILEGDTGGAQYLRAHPELVEPVVFDDPSLVWDMDKPEDYQRLLELDTDFDPFANDRAPSAP